MASYKSLKQHQNTILLLPKYDGHHKQQVWHSNVPQILRRRNLEGGDLWELRKDDLLLLFFHIQADHDHHAQTAKGGISQMSIYVNLTIASINQQNQINNRTFAVI